MNLLNNPSPSQSPASIWRKAMDFLNARNKKPPFFTFFLSFIVIVITSLPYLYGFLVTPPNSVFIGNGLFNPHDNHVYYSYIEQVKAGRYFLKDVFTAEQQTPFLNIFWLALGLMAKIFALSPISTFHLARILLIPLLFYALFKFADWYFASDLQKERKIKLALILFSVNTGFGGFLAIFYNRNLLPLEAWWPEAFVSLSSYASPHFIASWILLIASIFFLFRSINNDGVKNANWNVIAAGLSGLILTQFHTFYLALLIPLSIAIFFYFASEKSKNLKDIFLKITIYNLFFLPIIIYYFFLLKDTVMKERLFNAAMLTTNNLFIVFFAFGFVSILAFSNIIWLFFKKEQTIKQTMIIIWTIIAPLLLFAPIPFQKRLIEGWQFPLILLAVGPIIRIADIIKQKTSLGNSYNRTLFFLFFITPALTIFFSAFAVYHSDDVFIRQVYLPKNLHHALTWLKTKGNYDEVVLGHLLTSISAAFLADKTIYAGHKFETINIKQKLALLEKFFATETTKMETTKKEQLNKTAFIMDFLTQNRIKYIVWGPYEKNINFQPQTKNYFKEIYNQDGVVIYENQHYYSCL